MRKLIFALLVVCVLVSCTNFNPEAIENQGYASVRLGTLKAKDVSVSGSMAKANDLYWTYSATKADAGINTGKTNGFVAVSSSKGLGTEIGGFAPGKWTFAVKGYVSTTYTDENLIYVSKEKTVTIESGKNEVNFVVEVQDGSKGKITTTKPTIIAVGTESYSKFTMTWTGVYQGTDATVGNISATNGATIENVKQGIWKLTYTFTDNANNKLGTYTTSAYVMNGATTVIAFNEGGAITPEPEASTKTKAPANTAVGDVLTMGVFNGVDITWKVLAVDDANSRVLVISEDILALNSLMGPEGSFFDTYLWSKSLCCAWLNRQVNPGYLITDSLSEGEYCITEEDWTDITAGCNDLCYTFIEEYELSDIAMVPVLHVTGAPDIEGASTDITSETTNEKIFLLSYEEVLQYMPNESDRIAYFHEGLRSLCAENVGMDETALSEPFSWSTRTPYFSDYVLSVNEDGIISPSSSSYVSFQTDQILVRPAFWMRKN